MKKVNAACVINMIEKKDVYFDILKAFQENVSYEKQTLATFPHSSVCHKG